MSHTPSLAPQFSSSLKWGQLRSLHIWLALIFCVFRFVLVGFFLLEKFGKFSLKRSITWHKWGWTVREPHCVECRLQPFAALCLPACLAALWSLPSDGLLLFALRGYQQQDAHEFMRYLLDHLHLELQGGFNGVSRSAILQENSTLSASNKCCM